MPYNITTDIMTVDMNNLIHYNIMK